MAGRTPDEMRFDVRGFSDVLDKIAAAVCDYRDLGERFIFNTEGVFWKKDGYPEKFIEWDSRGQVLKSPKQVRDEQIAAARGPITYQELRHLQTAGIAGKRTPK